MPGRQGFAARRTRRPLPTAIRRTSVAPPGPSARTATCGRGPPARRDRCTREVARRRERRQRGVADALDERPRADHHDRPLPIPSSDRPATCVPWRSAASRGRPAPAPAGRDWRRPRPGRRHRRQRPARRGGIRGRDADEPAPHVLRANDIDAAVAERGFDSTPHAERVRLPRRERPAVGAVGEERPREAPHLRRSQRRAVMRINPSRESDSCSCSYAPTFEVGLSMGHAALHNLPAGERPFPTAMRRLAVGLVRLRQCHNCRAPRPMESARSC